MLNKLIFLVGPTAVGKTAISVELAGLINAEIVSCDSMQVYKGMDIGTSKPDKSLLAIIPHHMIDIIEPSDEFSVAQFRRMAVKAIEDIIARGKTPLAIGGSGLYVRVLIDGIFEGPSTDREYRARLEREADEFGAGILYKRLETADKEAALGIHPNDQRRILRALEVCEKAKAPISRMRANTVGLSDKYDISMFGLNMERPALYKNIDERVDLMFSEGLIEEARGLTRQEISLTASQALGYKEAFIFLKGERDIEETKRLIKRNTRHYAKRQLTWFGRDKRVEWIMLDEDFDPKEIAKKIWKKLS